MPETVPENHGGILSSSHAPHGADDAREVDGINENRTHGGWPGIARGGRPGIARDQRPGIALAIMLGAQLMIILDRTSASVNNASSQLSPPCQRPRSLVAQQLAA